MSILAQLEQKNKIEEQDFDKVSKLVFQSFTLNNKRKSLSNLHKKEDLIDSYTHFLKQYLELEFLSSKDDKLELINFIDKMNTQKELLALMRDETSLEKIKADANRLGNKSQSAFSTK